MWYSHRVTRRRKLCIQANSRSTFQRRRYAIIHESALPEDLYQRVYAVLSAIEDETLFDPKMPRGNSPDWLGLCSEFSENGHSKAAIDGQ